jgi:hypothetical protein
MECNKIENRYQRKDSSAIAIGKEEDRTWDPKGPVLFFSHRSWPVFMAAVVDDCGAGAYVAQR